MTGKYLASRCLVVVLVAAMFTSSQSLLAQQFQLPHSIEPQTPNRLALISDVNRTATNPEVNASVPVPFAPSSMTADSIPPFAAHPEISSTQPVTYEDSITFEENIPVEKAKKPDSIDECCEDLTAMIAGNLDSSISLEAKTRMIETALKMVARNVALKAEAKITKLKADHALEMARVQSQMMQMRSMTHVADQISQIAGPLYQSLENSNRQVAASISANKKISEMFAQLGYDRIEKEARVAQANRKRIQLSSPTYESTTRTTHAEIVEREMARLQQLVDKELESRKKELNEVQPAAYHQPLQPRRQPLEPIRRTNTYYPR